MKKIARSILAMAGAFSHAKLGVKTPTRAWEHDDQRLHKSDIKRLRKNAARARNNDGRQNK